MPIRTIPTCVLAACCFYIAWPVESYAQTHKDSAISGIRRNFQRINSDKSLRVVRLDEEAFSDQNTDNGGELSGYFRGDTLCKMVLDVGLSYAMIRWEYYFDKEQISFIYETEKDYPEDSATGGLNNNKVVLAFEGRYYYDNGALINTIFKGKKRFIEDSPAAYIKALPKMPEIQGYIKLLKKRAR
jgi:hypothetical protein